MRKILKNSFLAALILTPAYFAYAQFVPPPLALLATPQSPSPGETVTIEASTPTLNKDRIFFEWIVDGKGKPELSGLGKDSIKLTAGPVGSTIRVSVEISGTEHEVKPVSLVVNVSDLALSWFAETYVPRWYKGKALSTQNSVARVIAVPQIVIGGAPLRPENLIYHWSLDDQTNVLSGIGQQVFRFRLSDLPKALHQIRITVEDGEGRIIKEGRIFISALTPQVKIYPSSPLGGVEFRSGPSLSFTKLRGLFDFIAEPFFFSTPTRKNLSYGWRVADRDVRGSPENPNFLTIDTTGQQTGTMPISVTVDDANDIIPAALKTLTLILQ